MKLALDVDGVVADFLTSAYREHGYPNYNSSNIKSWNFHREIGISDEKFYEPISSFDFWDNIDLMPFAHDLYDELIMEFDVIFCTSPSKCKEAVYGKLSWLKRHFNVDTDEVIITGKKEILAHEGSLLIDDSGKNCARFQEAGGSYFWFPSLINKYSSQIAPYYYVDHKARRACTTISAILTELQIDDRIFV